MSTSVVAPTLLLLGGTGEARALAAALAAGDSDGGPRVQVISSLAGRVSSPALPVGAVRIGGFGGVAGLRDYLRDERVQLVVDATHPFARTISDHAAQACAEVGVALLMLRRPGWQAGSGDRWHRVADAPAAAAAINQLCPTGSTVFLTTGRRDLAAFTADPDRRYLIRTVDPPDGPLPSDSVLLLARGPYTVAGELELLRAHAVHTLVTKDSGGALTTAKLTAARELGLDVIMLNRPNPPDGVRTVDTVAAALKWIADQAGGW